MFTSEMIYKILQYSEAKEKIAFSQVNRRANAMIKRFIEPTRSRTPDGTLLELKAGMIILINGCVGYGPVRENGQNSWGMGYNWRNITGEFQILEITRHKFRIRPLVDRTPKQFSTVRRVTNESIEYHMKGVNPEKIMIIALNRREYVRKVLDHTGIDVALW